MTEIFVILQNIGIFPADTNMIRLDVQIFGKYK